MLKVHNKYIMNNTIRFKVPEGQYSLAKIAKLFPKGSKIEFSNHGEYTHIMVTTTSQYNCEDISALFLSISSMRKPENKVQQRGGQASNITPTQPAQHGGQSYAPNITRAQPVQYVPTNPSVQCGGMALVQQHRDQVQQHSPTKPSAQHRSQARAQPAPTYVRHEGQVSHAQPAPTYVRHEGQVSHVQPAPTHVHRGIQGGFVQPALTHMRHEGHGSNVKPAPTYVRHEGHSHKQKSNGPTMRQGPTLSQGAWLCPNSYNGD